MSINEYANTGSFRVHPVFLAKNMFFRGSFDSMDKENNIKNTILRNISKLRKTTHENFPD